MRPTKESKDQLRESRRKWRKYSTFTIILLSFFLLATLTAKITPPAPINEITIIRPEHNFCNYVYAHIKLSGDNYRIEFKINQDGNMQYTEYTKSLSQLTVDVRSIYDSELIDLDQYHCLLAGIKGHEMKAK